MAANNELHFHDMDDEEGQISGNKTHPVPSTTLSLRPQHWRAEPENKQQQSPTLSDMLGVNELFSLNAWRASLAELIGTGILVFMLDTITISTIDSNVQIPNLIIAVMAGIIITILIIAAYPISGGHINPIISFSAALVGIISMSRALIYIIAQCVGGILGALALKAVVDTTIQQKFSLGGCTITIIAPGPNGPVAIGVKTAEAFWLETFCSFIYLFASIWMAYDHRQMKVLGHVLVFSFVGIVLGLLVFISTSVTAQKGYGGAGINPARCFGPAVVRGGHLWDGHWVFWAGPAIGCIGFYVYTKIIPSKHHKNKTYDHDFYNVLKVMFRAR